MKEWVDKIADENLRTQVKETLSKFESRTLPKLKELPHQLIHNDANDWNIVTTESGPSLIDFGDAIFAPRIIGLAVAAAYIALESDDPTLSTTHLIRGYHMIAPLTPGELELLFDCITIRIASSIANAALQLSQNPENNYLSISQDRTPATLAKLLATNSNYALYRFRNAAGYDANPNSKKIRQYLTLKSDIKDVVSPPFKDATKIWIDWSIDNPNLPRTSEAVAKILKDSNSQVGIGRYCENRKVYESDAFAAEDPNARTFHLGVDLWMYAGAPVYAPLDGTIELFNDNTAYLDYGPVVILRHTTDDGTPFFTLYGHLSKTSLPNWSIGKTIKAGELIGWMGTEEENVGWPPHTHFQLITDLCGMGIDIYGVAPRQEVALWRSISLDPNLILRIPQGVDAHSQLSKATISNERKTVISQNLSLNFKKPLHITRGEGAFLIDETGRKYLDLVNNVAHVGHCHPRVVEAGARQMSLLNTNTRFLHQNIIEYARSLTSTLPDPLSVVFFVNSGSEANDLALRLAHAHTKARGVIALRHAYHGHTQSVVDISPYKFLGKGGAGKPDHVEVAELPKENYLTDFKETLQRLNQPLSAFFSESIVSTAGQIVLPKGYLNDVYKLIRERGGVCVSDEVQIGLGRVGEKFWGFQLQDVIPDIVTMGKPLGNGHPLAAVVTTPEIASSFNNGMEYFNTFGGNPVSTAIGQAVFDVVQDEGLQRNAHVVGEYLRSCVRSLAKDHAIISDVRGHGLFIGVEFMKDPKTPATSEVADLMEFALTRGVMLSCDGPANNVLKIKPPLIITEKEVDLFVNVLDEWLKR